MNESKLDSLDFRALRAFHVLLETRSVTATAKRLHVSQPTMSRILEGLRAALDDRLVVRMAGKLEPTPRAVALAPRVAQLVDAMRALMSPVEAPERRWRIAATDYAFFTVLQPFLEKHRVSLDVHRVSVETIGALERGDVDLALAPRTDVRQMSGLVVRSLFRDGHAVVARKGRAMTLRRYLAAEHVAVQTDRPGSSLVESALQRQGHTRNVVLRVASLSQALSLVETTDLVATLPARFVRSRDVTITEPPFPIDEIEMQMAFTPRAGLDPRLRQLREQLVRSAQ